MKPQRVAMLSMHTCPLATLGGKETGGMNVYVRDLSRELSRRGLVVDVFTRSQNPAIPSISHALGPGTRVIHIPAGPQAPLDKNIVFNHVPEFVDHVLALAEREGHGYDIIHSHYWLSGWAARDLRSAWGAPIVQMFHTLGHMKNSVAQTEVDKETDRRIEVEREIMSFADRLVAATPLERAQMAWLYGANPSRISVVPCGVDSNLFTPRSKAEARAFLELSDDQRLILFVGRIERLKGIDTLIRAMGLVLQRHPEWKSHVALSIIGGAPDDSPAVRSAEMERLRALRSELGLTDLVAFLGAKSQDTLPYYYSAAEMVVVPSHYESFGMVALEAMSCGTPVIASKVGGLSLIVQDGVTGYLVPEKDAPSLANQIELLLSKPNLGRDIGVQAAEWAHRFRWPNIATRITEIYDEVLLSQSGLPIERSSLTT
jgi:D-inositol-3-phosphate glycosyltransferase